MKLLDKEEITATEASLAAPRPAVRPNVVVRGRYVAQRAARRGTAPLQEFCGRTFLLACFVGGAYVASTLGGYVVLERARQSARHGAERARYAQAQAKEARASIETLTNPAALRAWAEDRGFVTGAEAPTPRDERVARR